MSEIQTESRHLISGFDEDIQRLHDIINEMGSFAITQLQKVAEAVLEGSEEKANEVIKSDKKLDKMEEELSKRAMKFMVRRQPLADDLREVLVAIKMGTGIERIGDYAKNIAYRINVLSESHRIGKVPNTIAEMIEKVIEMLRHVLDAYMKGDAKAAMAVRDMDVGVDEMNTKLFREILTFMLKDEANITPCAHLLFVAKNVERVGDFATGIAAQIFYLVTGNMPEERRPKADKSNEVSIT